MSRLRDGFTAVEVLVAMVIGVLLLGSAYQLYSTVVRDSGISQQRATASNYAYALLRQQQKNTSSITSPCTASNSTPSIPTSAGLWPNTTARIVIDCPYANSTNVSRISVTISYTTPVQGQVTRAVIVRP